MGFKKLKRRRGSSIGLKQWHMSRKGETKMNCIYKNCTNNSETLKKRDLVRSSNIVFFPFPKPSNDLLKFHKWLILSDVEDASLARQIDSCICSEHFRNGRPTKDEPDPVSHDETLTNSTEMPKKKRHLPGRKYGGKTIVIDDDQASSASKTKGTIAKSGDVTETLQMLYWSEDLSPAQLEVSQKREQEYNELINKLETLSKQNGGEVVYKGDGCTAYQFNSNPPALSSFNQSNGVSTPQETFATPSAMSLSQNNVVLQTKTSTGQNTYKLVMDPRLGLIVGTMTPAAQNMVTTAPNTPVVTATPAPNITTQVRPTIKKPRGRPPGTSNNMAANNNPPPLQALQQQFGPPIQPSTSANAPQALRPAECTAVGGLSAGTTASKQPAAIVDLTSDDGRPAPDSREVAFNKLQGKTFPSLVVVARPHLHAKEAASANDRSVLDTKVKSVLVHTPTKFTEWLIQQGLVRSEQYCAIHAANKLNLGMYSDVSKFPFSGGYVWISECCPHRFVSVFSGSLFEGAAHPPTVLLKLIYHWSCQTNIQNVVQWVKVDNLYVKGLFTWLRAVCSYALQQHLKPMGGPGKKIEVGVISLGTTSQDGSQRQVKVEVLGILDPESRLIRLRAVEPLADGERNYKRRFSKILEPLRNWVHHDSIIATDLTVDKGTLHFMGFTNIIQNTQSGIPGNQGVMEYLRKIVPRMFQNTLSLLSRQIIQQFLDELVWREWYGQTAAQAFNNMVIHLAEQTRMNVGETLIQRLNKVAANPFKNHTIVYQAAAPAPKIDTIAGVKRYGRKRAAPAPTAIIDLEKPKKIHISDSPEPVSTDPMVPLESYYYGNMEGEPNSALAQNVTLNVRCCVCKVPYTNNIELLDHLLAHAHNISSKTAVSQCRFCLASLPSPEELNTHINDLHPNETRGLTNIHPACVLCEQRFTSIYMLGKHMSKEHVPLELPYQCGTCGFRCSSHRQAIDHFYNQHNGAATVQCPFCLKSTAVWSSGRIMSTNVTFFLAHLQKHQKKSMAKKCHKCALWFIQKETLKEHQQKAHLSQAGKKGLKAWALPANYVMVPKSKIYQTNVISSIPPPPPSPPVEPSLHKLTLFVPQDANCKECHRSIAGSEHFPQKLSCNSCRYVTDCLNAMQMHKIKCRKSPAPTMFRFPLTADLHCICGFISNCGNQMAKHLALCERKTAYPTAEQAKSAVDNNSHSMLDVLGLVRRNDDVQQVPIRNFKFCTVPGCNINSVKDPNKIFIPFPIDYELRTKWFNATNFAATSETPPSMTSKQYRCCEDHFNFHEDAENYMENKMMGTRIRLKPNVVPHLKISKRSGLYTNLDLAEPICEITISSPEPETTDKEEEQATAIAEPDSTTETASSDPEPDIRVVTEAESEAGPETEPEQDQDAIEIIDDIETTEEAMNPKIEPKVEISEMDVSAAE